MNYQVIWDKIRVRFEQKVIDALNSGFKLAGGVSMTTLMLEEMVSSHDGSSREVLVWCQSVYKE